MTTTDELETVQVRWPHRYTHWSRLRDAEHLRRTVFIERERDRGRSRWQVFKRRIDLAISPLSMRGDAWLGLDSNGRVVALVRFVSPARTTELLLGALVWILTVALTAVGVSAAEITGSLNLFVACMIPIFIATIVVMSIITMARITAWINRVPPAGYFGVDFCSATQGDHRATRMMTEVRNRLNDPSLLIHADAAASKLIAHYEEHGFVAVGERSNGQQVIMTNDQ